MRLSMNQESSCPTIIYELSTYQNFPIIIGTNLHVKSKHTFQMK